MFYSILQFWILRNYYEGFIFNDNCVDDNDH